MNLEKEAGFAIKSKETSSYSLAARLFRNIEFCMHVTIIHQPKYV